MSKPVPFLKPQLEGLRFKKHTIPLDILKDLSVFEEMIIQVAKWKFFEKFPERRRIPRGFTDEITLSLGQIGEGSAIANINLEVNSTQGHLIPPISQRCYEESRDSICDAINAAAKGECITHYLPHHFLRYFDRIGRSLQDNESIKFRPEDKLNPACLNRKTRRALVFASNVEKITDKIVIYGTLSRVDKKRKRFLIDLANDTRIEGSYSQEYEVEIFKAFEKYEQSFCVQIQGIGQFDSNKNLQKIESIADITLSPPNEITSRLDEFRTLHDGWFEGKGFALSYIGLEWLKIQFEKFYPKCFIQPYIYPTP